MSTMVFKLGKSGMCCNTNHYIHACGYADAYKLDIKPIWKGGVYAPPGKDAWPQFFKRPQCRGSVVQTLTRSSPLLTDFDFAAPRGDILPKHYRDKYKCSTVLMPPRSRQRANQLITKHIKLQRNLADQINGFAAQHLAGRHVVGLHLRGPLRFHGGAIYFSDQLNCGHPSYPAYFREVDKRLQDDSVILLCTDAGAVVETVQERYGDRVVVPSKILPKKGEPHLAKKFKPYDLGVDVLSDAYLLAKSDIFVHGNSNVANFVLCLAPKMPHADIYGHLYHKPKK